MVIKKKIVLFISLRLLKVELVSEKVNTLDNLSVKDGMFYKYNKKKKIYNMKVSYIMSQYISYTKDNHVEVIQKLPPIFITISKREID